MNDCDNCGKKITTVKRAVSRRCQEIAVDISYRLSQV